MIFVWILLSVIIESIFSVTNFYEQRWLCSRFDLSTIPGILKSVSIATILTVLYVAFWPVFLVAMLVIKRKEKN